MTGYQVPRSVSPAIGWRAWRVEEHDARLWLCSLTFGVRWPLREPMRAACDDGRHAPPGERCSCGIYAADSLTHLQDMGYNGFEFTEETTVVIGEVKLWGKVVAGTQGWRAEFAYPSVLLVPYERWQSVRPLRDAYGVPVKLANTFKGGTWT